MSKDDKDKGDPWVSVTLKNEKELGLHLVNLALDSYDDADPGHDNWERVLFEEKVSKRMLKVASMLSLEFEFALERANHKPYRRGMGRLVGNARCNECQTFKPALTMFSVEPNGSCSWMVCDECIELVMGKEQRKSLPVIGRCGECAHFNVNDECRHNLLPRFRGPVHVKTIPPEWCPLRSTPIESE